MSQKILAVATSAAPTINGQKSGLYLSELTHFLQVVVEAGYDYDVASPEGGKIPLDEASVTEKQRKDEVNARFLADPAFLAAIEQSIPCADVSPDHYVAIYLAGGHGTMWDFRQSPALQKLLTSFYDQGRQVSAVCHGVSGLVDAVDGEGRLLLKGRRVTGYTNMEDFLGRSKSAMPFLLEDSLNESGADFKKNRLPFTSRVEVDGRILTGQNPQSARALGEAVVKALAG